MAAELAPAPVLITTEVAAGMLNVSPWTVRNLMADGTLPRIKIRSSLRTRRDAVLAYIERQSAADLGDTAAV